MFSLWRRTYFKLRKKLSIKNANSWDNIHCQSIQIIWSYHKWNTNPCQQKNIWNIWYLFREIVTLQLESKRFNLFNLDIKMSVFDLARVLNGKFWTYELDQGIWLHCPFLVDKESDRPCSYALKITSDFFEKELSCRVW